MWYASSQLFCSARGWGGGTWSTEKHYFSHTIDTEIVEFSWNSTNPLCDQSLLRKSLETKVSTGGSWRIAFILPDIRNNKSWSCMSAEWENRPSGLRRTARDAVFFFGFRYTVKKIRRAARAKKLTTSDIRFGVFSDFFLLTRGKLFRFYIFLLNFLKILLKIGILEAHTVNLQCTL